MALCRATHLLCTPSLFETLKGELGVGIGAGGLTSFIPLVPGIPFICPSYPIAARIPLFTPHTPHVRHILLIPCIPLIPYTHGYHVHPLHTQHTCIQLVPAYSEVESRQNISLETQLTTNYKIKIPLIASPMDTWEGGALVHGMSGIPVFNTKEILQ